MKRIYRDESQGKAGGVCAGIGSMLDIDPTIIRLIAIFLTIITGFFPGLVTYAVGWLLIPDKRELPPTEPPAEPRT